MPLESIKDKVDGNECDLSLNDLTAVPVKELVCNLVISPDNWHVCKSPRCRDLDSYLLIKRYLDKQNNSYLY